MTSSNKEGARQAADRARRTGPSALDPRFRAVRAARVGTPVLVYSPEGRPAFWLVPFIAGGVACGFARVEEPSLRVSQVGVFGAGPDDRASWPPAAFFERPPAALLQEIQSRYGTTATEPVLSYDGSPARWAWRVDVGDPGSGPSVFITPGGWYARSPAPDSGAEGKGG
jgi:hypothetical protein